MSGIWLGFIGVFLGQAAKQAELQTGSPTGSRVCGWRT